MKGVGGKLAGRSRSGAFTSIGKASEGEKMTGTAGRAAATVRIIPRPRRRRDSNRQSRRRRVTDGASSSAPSSSSSSSIVSRRSMLPCSAYLPPLLLVLIGLLAPIPIALAQSVVRVNYEGDDSQCDNTAEGRVASGRTFQARPATADDCPSVAGGGLGWSLDASLTEDGSRTVRIISCRDDEILTIQMEEGGLGGSFSREERDFFRTTAAGISSTNPSIDPDDPTTVQYQSIAALRLLADWPLDVPVSYTLDADAQRALQVLKGDPDTRFDDNPPSGPPPPTLPIPNYVQPDGRLYTTMCPHLTRYLDSGGLDASLNARLDASPSCDAASVPNYMMIWDAGATGSACHDVPMTDPPSLPAEYNDGWAVGSCFGRCGSGCPGGDESFDTEGDGTDMRQYTFDCARYDFCERFGLTGLEGDMNGTTTVTGGGGGGSGSTCGSMWLDLVDDYVWSGNCDFQTREEILPPPTGECGTGSNVDVSAQGGTGDGGPDFVSPVDPLEVEVRAAGIPGAPAPIDPDDPRERYRSELRALKPSLDALLGKEVRTIDGTKNNLLNPKWGSAHTPLVRRTFADYKGQYTDHNEHDPGRRRLMTADLPNPREISNALMRSGSDGFATKRKTIRLSDMVWQWGQFLDHDLVHSATNNSESAPIAVPPGDDMLDPGNTGTETIAFKRSEHTLDSNNVRQQVNGLTAFIDGSAVYGSDTNRSEALRTYAGGLLKTSEGDMMPYNRDALANAPHDRNPDFFLGGDVRSNEQIGLTAMHTVFVREHNLCARAINDIYLTDFGVELRDEEIYQLCRRIVGAEMQAVTYNEFVPALLGRDDALPTYRGYDSSVNPSILNEFSIAYRVGHIMLSSSLALIGPAADSGDVTTASGESSVPLQDVFFNNTAFLHYGIDDVLRGLSAQRCHDVQPMVVEAVRSMLFGVPGHGGMDLAALNIERGRDHGLPGYNDVREQYGLGRASTFLDVTTDESAAERLDVLYGGDVDSLDLWVGCVAEDRVAEDHVVEGSSMVGPTLFAILRDQFTNLRDGDRFWYETDLGDAGKEMVLFVDGQLLSDIIVRNTGIDENDLPRYTLTEASI